MIALWCCVSFCCTAKWTREVCCKMMLGALGAFSVVTHVLGNTGHLASPWEQVSEMGPSVSGLGMGWHRRLLRPCRVHLSDSFLAVGPYLVCGLLWVSTVDLPESGDATETWPHVTHSGSLEDRNEISNDLPSPTVFPGGWKRNPVSQRVCWELPRDSVCFVG